MNQSNIPAGNHRRDNAFTTNSGIGNLQPTEGTFWIMFVDKFSFDCNGYPLPVNIINRINYLNN